MKDYKLRDLRASHTLGYIEKRKKNKKREASKKCCPEEGMGVINDLTEVSESRSRGGTVRS